MLGEWMPALSEIDALHYFGAEDSVSREEELGSGEPLLVFRFLAAVLGSLLCALTCALRSSNVVGVLIWFLHRELQNKACRFASQEFLEKFAYTKVTGGGEPPPPVTQSGCSGGCRTAAEQMHDERNHRESDQDMNQAARNVKRQPEYQPDHCENNRKRQ
jgi:hypothetical protein